MVNENIEKTRGLVSAKVLLITIFSEARGALWLPGETGKVFAEYYHSTDPLFGRSTPVFMPRSALGLAQPRRVRMPA
jgi:hypothetical protein